MVEAKALLKRVVPASVRTAARNWIGMRARIAGWRRARRGSIADAPARGPFRSLLIIPSDPWQIVGSRGDDAMVSTAIAQARRRNPDCRIGVVTVAAPLPVIVAETGAVPEPLWLGSDCKPYLQALERYDSVAVIGADVMDGHYSVADAARAWIFADLAARAGKRAFVVGFSFSDRPAPELGPILRDLSPDLAVFTRDAVSKTVFDAMASTPSELVSDSAFLLAPSPTAPDHQAVAAWAAAQRHAGRFVCAFNTHPMVFKDCDPAKMAALNDRFADALRTLAERHPVAFLLIPHDFRDEVRGDNAALGPLNRALAPTLRERVFHATSACRAAELKALVGIADMLVTGRMHLGVAALSMGVPMWAINPQDKFVGLFQHFGLPDQRLNPEAALDRGTLHDFLDAALRDRPAVTERVRDALPEVKRRAERNFELLQN